VIKFYFHDTPNPRKIALFLEESGLAYEVIPVDLLKGEQHNPEYRAINPNGKAPAVVDDGIVVFDSSAILIYLADKTGLFFGRRGTGRPLLVDVYRQRAQPVLGPGFPLRPGSYRQRLRRQPLSARDRAAL
jgi:glutathione S-transferase